MSDVQPQEAFGVAFGVTVSGQTQPYDLGGDSIGGQVRAVQAVSAVSAVSGSVQVSLQALASGNPDSTGTWSNVVALPSQSAAGVQVASATVPATVAGKFRLAWTVTGSGATIAAFAIAVG